MYSISIDVQRHGSSTYKYDGSIADGTYINQEILNAEPNPTTFLVDGKDTGNVCRLSGHVLDIVHRQVKHDKGLTKYPQWSTATEEGKHTVYKTNNVSSLPIGQIITYAPSKDVKVAFKVVQEISDGEEEFVSDDEVQIVTNAAGGSAGGAAVKSENAAKNAEEEKAAAEKAAAEKAATEKAAADAQRLQEINLQIAEQKAELTGKLEEAKKLQESIFRLKMSAAEFIPDSAITIKKMPELVKNMVSTTTQTPFSAFRANERNEDVLREWELVSNKILLQEQKVYTNRNVIGVMEKLFKLWAEDNAERAVKYEKRAKDFTEAHQLDKAKAAVKAKEKHARKLQGKGNGGSAAKRFKKNEKQDKSEEEPSSDESKEKDFSFDAPAGYPDSE
jgi:hypothetical protein